MKKSEARSIYRDKRNRLSSAETSKMDDLMLIRFQSVDLPFLNHLFTYWPIIENNEPNTHLFTEYLRFRNPELRIAYPIADFEEKTMTAIAVDIDTGFIKKDLNIFEPEEGDALLPEEIDLVIVPLLAFDKKGYRVGYGHGFYDKYLARCRPDCIKAGFSYFEPVDELEGLHANDVPLDICITPESLYVF